MSDPSSPAAAVVTRLPRVRERFRLGIEVRALSAPAAGVARYLRGLLPALRLLLPEAEIVLLGQRGAATPAAGLPVVPVGPAAPAARPYWDALALPRAVRRQHLDLLHRTKPAWVPRGAGDPPTVMTIYDCIPLQYPRTQTFAQRTYWRFHLRAAAQRAAHIVTISEASKRSISECLGVLPGRISVTLPGLEPRFQPAEAAAVASVRRTYRLARPYLLTVGTIEPRKNVDVFLRAAAALAPDIPHDVVLAGRWGWKTERVRAALQDPRLTARVRVLGEVSDEHLPALYSGADAFVFLSAAEGFGFPPLEALACGVPVVASERGSLPEAVGDAALTVNPEDLEAVVAALRRVLGEPALRGSLAERAAAWVRPFTWARTAQGTVAAYARALAT